MLTNKKWAQLLLIIWRKKTRCGGFPHRFPFKNKDANHFGFDSSRECMEVLIIIFLLLLFRINWHILVPTWERILYIPNFIYTKCINCQQNICCLIWPSKKQKRDTTHRVLWHLASEQPASSAWGLAAQIFNHLSHPSRLWACIKDHGISNSVP